MRISDWSSDVCSSDLPAADAHRLEPITNIAAAHLVEHRRSDAHARHTDRMTERNAGAIDVQNVEPAVAFAPAPLLEDGENLGREGLVEFDQSDVAPVEPRPGEQPFDRGNRNDPHPRWTAARGRPAPYPTPQDEDRRVGKECISTCS